MEQSPVPVRAAIQLRESMCMTTTKGSVDRPLWGFTHDMRIITLVPQFQSCLFPRISRLLNLMNDSILNFICMDFKQGVEIAGRVEMSTRAWTWRGLNGKIVEEGRPWAKEYVVHFLKSWGWHLKDYPVGS